MPLHLFLSSVYHLHTSAVFVGSPVSDWRDEMNAFNLEFPSICLRAMNQGSYSVNNSAFHGNFVDLGYATCGVEYQASHYSGNFFWANCAHISKLPPLWDPLNNAWYHLLIAFKESLSLITALVT